MATVPSGQSTLPSASFVTQAEPEQAETEQPSQKREGLLSGKLVGRLHLCYRAALCAAEACGPAGCAGSRSTTDWPAPCRCTGGPARRPPHPARLRVCGGRGCRPARLHVQVRGRACLVRGCPLRTCLVRGCPLRACLPGPCVLLRDGVGALQHLDYRMGCIACEPRAHVVLSAPCSHSWVVCHAPSPCSAGTPSC